MVAMPARCKSKDSIMNAITAGARDEVIFSDKAKKPKTTG